MSQEMFSTKKKTNGHKEVPGKVTNTKEPQSKKHNYRKKKHILNQICAHKKKILSA